MQNFSQQYFINHGTYRHSFQGQEKDDEIKGEGNSMNYKYRMHDTRIGRFFAVDPLAPKYAYNSPYAFSENRVIDGIELEGLEWIYGADGRLIAHRTDNPELADFVVIQRKFILINDQLVEVDYYGYQGPYIIQETYLYNGDGDKMTHDQFMKRVWYNWGEGQSAPPLYYAHAMANRAKVRGGESGIYSSRSEHKMKDGKESDNSDKVNKNYLKFKEYVDNGYVVPATWSNADARKLQQYISAHLKANSGITSDPVYGLGYWFGGYDAISEARQRHSNSGSSVNMVIVMVYKGTDPNSYTNHLNDLNNSALWSINIFFDYGNTGNNQSAADVKFYDTQGNLIGTSVINENQSVQDWQNNNSTEKTSSTQSSTNN